eukprot:478624-Hanusia_phi.AAC.2
MEMETMELETRRRSIKILEQEHERLFYSCAISLRRGFRGNASFFLATDLPVETRKGTMRESVGDANSTCSTRSGGETSLEEEEGAGRRG